jgi:hypothetical protein
MRLSTLAASYIIGRVSLAFVSSLSEESSVGSPNAVAFIVSCKSDAA